MGGAAAIILLPELDAPALSDWCDIVTRRSKSIEDQDFWIAPGDREARGGLPFFWHREPIGAPLSHIDDDELAQIRDAFGLSINAGITIGARCRGMPSDGILGELCLEYLAHRDGLVQFDGLLVPTLDHERWRAWNAKDDFAQAADFAAAIGPHPGKITAINCSGVPSYHVCDAHFLAFWMTHEAFHFVN